MTETQTYTIECTNCDKDGKVFDPTNMDAVYVPEGPVTTCRTCRGTKRIVKVVNPYAEQEAALVARLRAVLAENCDPEAGLPDWMTE